MTKECARCREVKPLTMFGVYRRRLKGGISEGLQSYCKACRVALASAFGKANPAKTRDTRRRMKLRKNYGITPDQHAAQLAAQGGNCAVCKASLGEKSPQTVHVDHCHATGKLRGILCGNCNVALGNFKDDVATMKAAIAYLLQGGAWTQGVAA